MFGETSCKSLQVASNGAPGEIRPADWAQHGADMFQGNQHLANMKLTQANMNKQVTQASIVLTHFMELQVAYGCGSKNRYQNGMVSGNMDQNLRFAPAVEF